MNRLQAAREKINAALLAELNAAGHWTGELSSSALSTAVATIALAQMRRPEFVTAGLRWLAANANPDGGWGDTIRSQSNLSTTALCWAAFAGSTEFPRAVERAEYFLGDRKTLPARIAAVYGKDKTFSIPILMTLALTGRIKWSEVQPLPFELAALPRSWFGAMQLPVVSYALPALIAIGQTIHHHTNSKNVLRNLTRARTLKILTELQPANGGFLEATPLTAFVTMSLASMGHREHILAQRGAQFLINSIRPDGSWPIDTNLATWVTTLAIKALGPEKLPREKLERWLLDQQYKTEHPYTGAAPGGWAWTDLPGGVPDADDTAGALLALRILDCKDIGAVEAGLTWLLDLQNRDGGIPTFCRGWGALPFDRSAPELTAHAIRAWTAWEKVVSPSLGARINHALPRAFNYLCQSQRQDGSWIPLWFGNESAPNQENPVYGTAQVLITLNELGISDETTTRAITFLRSQQLKTGGWGGAANTKESLEETALCVEALADGTGLNRLLDLIAQSAHEKPAPLGLYFARLWYSEKLYPLIFTASALNKLSETSR